MSTDIQLRAWCRKNIGATFIGVFERNTLPAQLPHNCDLIVSYGKHEAHGSTDVLHWCALKKRGGFGLWCDPMGRAPDADSELLGLGPSSFFQRYLQRQCRSGFSWNTQRLEQWGGTGPGSTTCGEWSCAMLKWGTPETQPKNWVWLTSSLRRNNELIRQIVRLE